MLGSFVLGGISVILCLRFLAFDTYCQYLKTTHSKNTKFLLFLGEITPYAQIPSKPH
jgi:hypothetical protein